MKVPIRYLITLMIVVSSCQKTYTISTEVTPTGSGSIEISPAKPEYEDGEIVTLTATPNQYWEFQNWQGDGDGNGNSIQMTINSNKKVVGVFVKRDYNLKITITGEGTVEEKVIANPSGREHPSGTIIELTAKAKENYYFTGWEGDLTGIENPKRITIDKEKNITANFKILNFLFLYPPGTNSCLQYGTAIIEVINPKTGKTWMDRNLDASSSGTGISQTSAGGLAGPTPSYYSGYGGLYQWGRFPDAHQCRSTTFNSFQNPPSQSDRPDHGGWIPGFGTYDDWRSPRNDNLWQGVNGINNPCPAGYRLPTEAEWNAERLTWTANNAGGAFLSPLRLPKAGRQNVRNFTEMGKTGAYWSSTISGRYSIALIFDETLAGTYQNTRARGNSVRCIKN
jgi:uncharacterized repeat protein (TIGR02543 family)